MIKDILLDKSIIERYRKRIEAVRHSARKSDKNEVNNRKHFQYKFSIKAPYFIVKLDINFIGKQEIRVSFF